jgi:hypothetical protein
VRFEVCHSGEDDDDDDADVLVDSGAVYREERGYGTQWVMVRMSRSRKQLCIALQCSGGFQKLVCTSCGLDF